MIPNEATTVIMLAQWFVGPAGVIPFVGINRRGFARAVVACLLELLVRQEGYKASGMDFPLHEPLIDGEIRYGITSNLKERQVAALYPGDLWYIPRYAESVFQGDGKEH